VHQEEIVKNLCIQREMEVNNCNGHCFLSKQLKKAAEKEKKESESLREKQELVYINSFSEDKINSLIPFENKKIYFSFECEKNKSIPFSIFHPPLA
jgi:hypothetical protein